MGKRIRTFVALELPGSIKNRAVRMQGVLAQSVSDTKWVEAENMHITLKFLGEVLERDLYHVCRIAQRVARQHEPFELEVKGVGAFPHARRPRVLWAGVGAGNAALCALQEMLDREYAEAGWASEGRRFQPHVTLGRVRRPRANTELEGVFRRYEDWKAGRMEVDELVVLSSELTKQGPVYAVLARAPLYGVEESVGGVESWVSLGSVDADEEDLDGE